MKTLVIHPQDKTTDFLTYVYAGKGWDAITTNVSKSYLKSQIKSHDRIIMLGHGTEAGLYGFSRFIIDSSYVYLLREKDCVCVWCKANEFVDKYGLKGFHIGMIISEYEEAVMYCINATDDELLQSNLLFSHAVRLAVESISPLETFKKVYDIKTGKSAVILFNQQNVFLKMNTSPDVYTGKNYLNLRIRLRQDSGESSPAYTTDEIFEKLTDNKVKFTKNSNETIFLCDIDKNDKIMGVIE